MTEDQRRNKLSEQDCFYLELHQHGGNFEAMLTPDELTIWNMFPDFHQRFFTYFKNQEWEIVSSLRRFSDDTVIGRVNGAPVTKADQAVLSMQFYHHQRQHYRATLTLDELKQLLFPLRELSGDLLRQPIAEALYLHTTDPDIAAQRDSPGWQEYGVWLQPIPLAWLENQESEYLRECANVWRSYLEPDPQYEEMSIEEALAILNEGDELELESGRKPDTQAQIDKWNREVERLWKAGGYRFHRDICKRIVADGGGSPDYKHIADETRATYRRLNPKKTK